MRRVDLFVWIVAPFLALTADAARFPAWAEQATAAVNVDAYADDAVVLLDEWHIVVKEGARSGTRRRLVSVLTDDGREHAAVRLSSGPLSRYEEIRLWIRDPSGRVWTYSEMDGTLFGLTQKQTLDDESWIRLAPPGVQSGSQIAVEMKTFNAPVVPQDRFRVQEAIPVARKVIVVDARKGWDVEGRASRVEPDYHEVDGERVWEFRDLPATAEAHLDSSAPRPPTAMFALNYIPPGGASPFRNWNSTARWALELFKPLQVTLAQDAGAEAQAEGLRDSFHSAATLSRGLRYFSILIGTGAFVPRPAALTLERGFGDCKDKAQVMIATLAHAKLEAYPVLTIARSDGYVAEDLPSPFAFNHAIVAVRWNEPVGPDMTVVEHPTLGPLRFYDATMSSGSVADTGLHLEGAAVLVLHPSTTDLLRLPQSSAERNRSIQSHDWKIDGEGNVSATFRVAVEGFFRGGLQDEVGQVLAGRELYDSAERPLSYFVPEFHSLEVGPVDVTGKGIWYYEGSYAVPGAVSRAGRLRAIELGPFARDDFVPLPYEPPVGKREASEPIPAYLPVVGFWEDSVRLHLVGGNYVGAESGFEVSNAAGRVKLELQPGTDGLFVSRTLAFRMTEVAPEDGEQLRELRAALRRLNRLVLLFE